MKVFLKFFNAVTIAATIYVAFIAAVFVVPRLMGVMPYIVLSASMDPTMPAGSVAFINQKDRDVDIGDIITYKLGDDASVGTGNGKMTQAESGTLVTHRLMDFTSDGMIITKGDNNDVADISPIYPSQVVGTYIFHIPRLGLVMAKIGKKMLMSILFGVIALNLANAFLSWAWEDDDEKEKEEKADAESKTRNEPPYLIALNQAVEEKRALQAFAGDIPATDNSNGVSSN